jgi:hypothetical protein
MYFLFRFLVRDHLDVERMAGQIAWTCTLVFALFLVERLTGRNPFAFLGGVPEMTNVREGRMRCQGPFQHAILAGVFWATLLPIVGGSWLSQRKGRFRNSIGILCILGIVGLTASSTPVMAVLVGMVGWLGWTLREFMRPVRWLVLGAMVALHMVMNNPIWHLIGRLNIVGGSTGYHRYRLIQAAVDNFGEWWLIGVNSTWQWGRQMHDVTNHYIRVGVGGGLITLLLFIGTMAMAFRAVGIARRRWRVSPGRTKLCWGVGVALFVQMIIFISISISHSHQNLFVFYCVCAAASSLQSSLPSLQYSRRPAGRLQLSAA